MGDMIHLRARALGAPTLCGRTDGVVVDGDGLWIDSVTCPRCLAVRSRAGGAGTRPTVIA